MTNTTLRNVRVPDELWDAAKAKASAEGTDLSTLIRMFLSEYADRPLSAEQRAIQQAIAFGLDGEAIEGIELLMSRFPGLAESGLQEQEDSRS